MNIPITEIEGYKFIISSDEQCYILKEIKIGQSGKSKDQEREIVLGYHGTMMQVMNNIRDTTGRRISARTLTGYIKQLKEIDKAFEEIAAKMEIAFGQKDFQKRMLQFGGEKKSGNNKK